MKLYIGNIPFDAREEELRELFAAYGTPRHRHRDRGSPRAVARAGSASSSSTTRLQGKAAIAGVNGTEFGGRTLVVNEARSRDGGSSGYRGSRGGYAGRPRRPRIRQVVPRLGGGRPRF